MGATEQELSSKVKQHRPDLGTAKAILIDARPKFDAVKMDREKAKAILLGIRLQLDRRVMED
jgi:hypothetical protein